MRIAFIGCVELSQILLRRVLALPEADVVGVITRERSPINADHRSLVPLATEHALPYLVVEGNNQDDMAGFLTQIEPDVTYCFGWSYILRRPVLDVAPRGVVGYHPAELPMNRGRHPLIWALALGLERTASTFFLMDDGVDSGPIIDQTLIPIARDDDAASLYRKVTKAAQDQVARFTPAFAAGSLQAQPQDHSRANLWRRRGAEDGGIDWRMSAEAIYNLVRALTTPYVGAHVASGGHVYKVWRCEMEDVGRPNDEPGKVLQVQGETITVRCFGGAIRLLDHEIRPLPDPGDYL